MGEDGVVMVGSAVALLLGVVFVLAATAKVADRPATARGFRALGFRATYPLSVAVPAVEAVLAVALVVHPRVGGVAAAGLLAVFSAVLVDRLSRGFTAPCNCFGSSGSRPLSLRHLYRNGGLAGAALVASALSTGGFVAPAWAIPSLVVLVAAALIRLGRS